MKLTATPLEILLQHGSAACAFAALEPLEPRLLLSAPQAVLHADGITRGGHKAYSFVIEYQSNQALDLDTLDGRDIQVIGPGGYSQLARLMSILQTQGPLSARAIYRIEAPGGTWDAVDNGDYVISLSAGQIANESGEVNLPSTLGQIHVDASTINLEDEAPRTLGTLTELTILNNLNSLTNPVRQFEFQVLGTGSADHFVQLVYAKEELDVKLILYRRDNNRLVKVGKVKTTKSPLNTQGTVSRRISLKDVPAGTYVVEIDGTVIDYKEGSGGYYGGYGDDDDHNVTYQRNPHFSLAIHPATDPSPDLVPTELLTSQMPSMLTLGEAIKTQVVLSNRDLGTLKGSVNIELYLSTNATLDSGDVLVGANATRVHVGQYGYKTTFFNSNLVTLRSGKSKTVTVKGAIPSNMPEGTYFLLAKTEAGGFVPESNEANNLIVSARQFTITHSFGTFGGRKNVAMKFTEPDGTIATLTLSGVGHGELTRFNSVASLVLRGTTTKSKLTIKVSGGTGRWQIQDLTVGDLGDPLDITSLGRVSASTTTLLGTVTATGSIDQAKFANLRIP